MCWFVFGNLSIAQFTLKCYLFLILDQRKTFDSKVN